MKFKASILPILKIFIYLNIGCIIFCIIEGDWLFKNLLFIYVINASVIIALLINKNLLVIEFEEEKITIKYFQLFIIKNKSYKYENLSFSNNKQMVGRGHIEHVLRLFSKSKRIISVYPSLSGFDSQKLNGILEVIKEKSLPQIDSNIL